MKDQILFILTGPLIVLLGAGLTVTGYFEPEVRSFLWPFDGIIALIGGIGLTIWVLRRFIPRL
jgi:hypothetical protein